MRRRPASGLLVTLLLLMGLGASHAGAAGTTEPAFLTLLQGRGLSGLCLDDPRVFTLDDLSSALAARRVPATAIVILNRTGETQRMCIGGRRYASWADYRRLHDSQGWDVVSGDDHTHLQPITSSTNLATQQTDWDETCGTLDAFRSHGFDASALYAYGGGPVVDSVQDAYVSKCFAYGRHYGSGLNNRSGMASPWYQSTLSVNGGRCNNTAAPCYTQHPAQRRYVLPSSLATLFRPSPGQWATFQNYNLVRGTRVGEAPTSYSWDCSSPDPRLHWTSLTELYCADDYLYALDHRGTGVTVTTPAAVARAWGRGSLPGVARPTGSSNPTAPTGLTATAVSSSSIQLGWNAVNGATGYRVSRSGSSGGPYGLVASPGTATYTDSGRTANTPYFYVVQAVNNSGASANSPQASATTRLATPSGVAATAVNSSQVDLSWSAVSGANSYKIARATSAAGPFGNIGVSSTTTYSDTGAAPGTMYFYVVQAQSASNWSANSRPVSVTTAPAPPTNLTATPQLGPQIDLSWDASYGATEYQVYRSTTSGSGYEPVGSPTSATSFSDTGVAPLTTYYYVVRAINVGGYSGDSNEASATTTV